MSYLNAFNQILIEFAKNLETTFPEDSDFKMTRQGLEQLLKYNKLAAHNMFKQYVAPVEVSNEKGEQSMIDISQKILDGDSSFFLETMDYETKLKENGADDTNSFNTITKLKTYWKNLSPQGQETVMKYLKSLVQLSQQIN